MGKFAGFGGWSKAKTDWFNAHASQFQQAFGDDWENYGFSRKQLNSIYKFGDSLDPMYWQYLNGTGRGNAGGIPISDLMASDIDRQMNSASYTVGDFAKAGLNPALMFGGQNSNQSAGEIVNNADTAADTATVAMDGIGQGIGAIQAATGVAGAVQDIKVGKTQADVNTAQRDVLEAQAENIRSDTRRKDQDYDINEDLRDINKRILEGTASKQDYENRALKVASEVAETYGLDKAKLEVQFKYYETKIAEIDSQTRESLNRSVIALNRSLASKNEQDIRESIARVEKIGKECAILDKDASSYDSRLFLEYAATAFKGIESVTGAKDVSIQAAGSGFKKGQSQIIEGLDGYYGNISQTLRDKFGGKEYYSEPSELQYRGSSPKLEHGDHAPRGKVVDQDGDTYSISEIDTLSSTRWRGGFHKNARGIVYWDGMVQINGENHFLRLNESEANKLPHR